MADQRERMLGWLNDAYAMEQAVTEVLENHAKAAADHPRMQARIEEHLEETRRHADLVKECIDRLGGDTSTLKSGMASIFGMIQGMSTGMADDQLIKNVLNDYSSEYFEIAAYTALRSAAETLGDHQTARICDQIIQDEHRMADWLEQNLPMVVEEDLHQLDAG